MIITRQLGKKSQVVIPRDVREVLGLKERDNIVFEIRDKEVNIKGEQNPEEFLADFLNVPKPKRNLTLKDLREIEEESYDLP